MENTKLTGKYLSPYLQWQLFIVQELSDCWHCCGYCKVCVKKALPGALEETNNKENETNDTAFGNNYIQTLLTFFNKLISVLLFSSFHVPNKCTKWVQKVNIRFPRQ